MTKPNKGITADRKSPDKLQFIIENHSKLTRKQLSEALHESERWVKRQVHLLVGLGKLSPSKTPPEKVFSMADWDEDLKGYVMELHNRHLKSIDSISEILEKERGIIIKPPALGYWMRKFGCGERTRLEWLRDYIPKKDMEKFIDQGMLMVDIAKYVHETYGVYVTDDTILEYVQSLGLMSQRQRRNYDPREKIKEYSKEWLENEINSHNSLVDISKKIGVSTTILSRRLKEHGIDCIEHRITWSMHLDNLREGLMNVSPIEGISPEDLHQMLLGWILGDGHINKYGRIVINHSLVQTDYLYLKARVLRNYLSNVCTVPRGEVLGDKFFVDKKEQLGISCPGFLEYTKYLLPNGNKDLEGIVKELSPLGWACYYMDDGNRSSSFWYISAKKGMIDLLKNRYNFGNQSGAHSLVLKEIDDAFIIPSMRYKAVSDNVGSFWMPYAPELFSPDIKSDLDLALVNGFSCDKDESILNRAVEYYHKRGFPYIELSDIYLKKEMENLRNLKTGYMWREGDIVRSIETGNNLFKHFMRHMVEAQYKHTSPMEVFNSFMPLRKCLQYCLKAKKSILPNFVHNALVYFNGGVSGFPCGTAKAIVEKFSKNGAVVVDPCTGWGGRLLGVTSSNRAYVGFEPWDKTHDSLMAMTKFLGIENFKVHHGTFDRFLAPKECDLVFTSPPYLDLEVYGKPISREKWDILIKDIFLYSEEHLSKTGYLVLNLPRPLRSMLPKTTLKEHTPIYWFSSTRIRDIEKAEICYVWGK